MSSQDIDRLKRDLELKEKNLILAAQYGKNLLDLNAELELKIKEISQEHYQQTEELQQEKYKLSLELQEKKNFIKSLLSDLENQEKRNNERMKGLTTEFSNEIQRLNRKVSDLENCVEALQKEVKIHSERALDLEHTLATNVNHRDKSYHSETFENNREDYIQLLQQELDEITEEKQQKEKETLELKSQINTLQLSLTEKEKLSEKLRDDFEEISCQMTSLYNEIERIKIEKEELKMELEDRNLSDIDLNKKGNSLFAEIEDNRQLLENRVILMASKISGLKSQCQAKTQEVSRLKVHIASLIGRESNEADVQYQKELEKSLSAAKEEVKCFMNICKDLEQQLKECKSSQCGEEGLEHEKRPNSRSYIEYLYENAKKKMQTLEKEVRTTLFAKVCLEDENLQLKRKLLRCEKALESKKSELVLQIAKTSELLSMKEINNDNEGSRDNKPTKFYEKLPSPSKASLVEPSNTERSLPVLKEKFICISANTDVQEDPIKIAENITQENKENINLEDKTLCEKKKKKSVQFTIKEEKSDEAEKKELLKPQRKKKVLSAPHVKVTAESESEDCKIQ